MKRQLKRLFLAIGITACLASFVTASAAVIDLTAPYEGDYFLAYSNRFGGSAANGVPTGPMPAALLLEEDEPADDTPESDVIAIHTDEDGRLLYQMEPRNIERWAKPPENVPAVYSSRAATPAVGDRRNFITTNVKTGASTSTSFILKYSGEHCNIWRETNDIRGVTDEMIVELGAEYDVNIHSRMTSSFGAPLDRDHDGKIAILLYDIQDGYPQSNAYIGGFFSPGDLRGSNFNSMDVLHIDTYPSIFPSKDLSKVKSTMVHELQHLIESSANPLSLPIWINEGLSMAAEHMIYGPLDNRIQYYNSSVQPGVSLVDWNNQNSLPNYSMSYLFFQYLRIQTQDFTGGGEDLYRYIIHSYDNSSSAVELAMQQFYPNISFQELFRNFYIALTLKEPSGSYGFGGEAWADAIQEKLYTDTASKSLGPGAALVKKMSPGSSFTPTPNYKGYISYAAFSSSPENLDVDPPRADVPSGTVPSNQLVNLSCGEPNAAIYYTLDGSLPDKNSPVYVKGCLRFINNDEENPLTVTLRAVTITADGRASQVCQYEYTVSPKEPTPPPPTLGSYGNSTGWDTVEAYDQSGIIQVGQIDKAAFGSGGTSGLVPHENAEQEGYIAKYDYDNNLLWIRSFGGDYVTHLYGVTALPDGYVASGHYDRKLQNGTIMDHAGDFEDVEVGDNENPNGSFLVKFDLEGSVQWLTTFPNKGDAVKCSQLFHVIPCSDGGLVAAGYYNGYKMTYGFPYLNTYLSDSTALLIKVDSQGQLLWEKTFDRSIFFSVEEISDGSTSYLAAAGSVRGDSLGSGPWAGCSISGASSGTYHATAVILDLDGNPINASVWGKVHPVINDSSRSTACNVFTDLVPLLDGGFVAVGLTLDHTALAPLPASVSEVPETYMIMAPNGNHRMSLAVRFDASGTPQWHHVLNDGLSGDNSGHHFSSAALAGDSIIALLTATDRTYFGYGELKDLPNVRNGVVCVKFDLESGETQNVSRYIPSSFGSGYSYNLSLAPVHGGRFVIGGSAGSSYYFLIDDGSVSRHHVSGTIRLANNNAGLPGVSVAQTYSALNGAYQLTLQENESVTITPSFPGYTFSPASRTVTMGMANITGIDFTAQEVTYTLTGTITDQDGTPLPNVSIAGSSTDSNGNYTLTCRPGVAVVLTPSMAGKTFQPAHYTIPAVSQDTSGLDFRVPTPRHTVSGTITRAGQGQGGVRIGNTITAPDGSYTLSIEEGDAPILSPSFQAYAFQPQAISLSPVSGDISGQDFIMLPDPAAVEVSPLSHDFGSLEEGYSPLAPVTITLTNTGDDSHTGLTISLPEDSAFELSDLTETTLNGGESISFTVKPKDGLAAGSYSSTITIQGDSLLKYVTVTFQVSAHNDTPPSGDDNPPSGDDNPPSGDDNPPSGDDNPPSGDDNPPSGDDNPPSGDDNPPSDNDTPSSNDDASSGESPTAAKDRSPELSPSPVVTVHAPYLVGYSDGTFHPDSDLTRGQCAAILARLSPGFDPDDNFPSLFPDVPQDRWYASSIGYTASVGLVNGYPDGSFQPDAPITRGEFATLIRNFLGLESAGGLSFSDVENHWARYAIAQLSQAQILDGYPDGTFRPDAPITRAEAVKVLNYALDRIPQEELLRSRTPLSFPDLSDTHWAYFNIYEGVVEHTISEFHK